MSGPTDADPVVGRLLSAALDNIKHVLREPEAWNLSIYLGRKDAPQNAYLVGSMEPRQLVAAIQSLELDGERIGMVNRDSGINGDAT